MTRENLNFIYCQTMGNMSVVAQRVPVMSPEWTSHSGYGVDSLILHPRMIPRAAYNNFLARLSSRNLVKCCEAIRAPGMATHDVLRDLALNANTSVHLDLMFTSVRDHMLDHMLYLDAEQEAGRP